MKSTKPLLLAAAFAGLCAGTAHAVPVSGDTGVSIIRDDGDKSTCKAKETCKSKESCKSKTTSTSLINDDGDKSTCKSKSTCKAKETCKGKEGCGAKS